MNVWIQRIRDGYDRLDRSFKRGFNRVFYSCEHMTELSSRSIDSPLSIRQRFTRRIHLFLCTWCRRYDKQLRFLRKNASRYAEKAPEVGPNDLTPEARERIRTRLHKEIREDL